jgi:hypothetical protein
LSQSKVTGGIVINIPNPEPQKQAVVGVGGSVIISSSALPSGAATDGTLQAILAAILAGGGGVTWPLTMDVILADPAPNPTKWQLYVFSDGVASPNNVQTCKLMLPNGVTVPLYSETL